MHLIKTNDYIIVLLVNYIPLCDKLLRDLVDAVTFNLVILQNVVVDLLLHLLAVVVQRNELLLDILREFALVLNKFGELIYQFDLCLFLPQLDAAQCLAVEVAAC